MTKRMLTLALITFSASFLFLNSSFSASLSAVGEVRGIGSVSKACIKLGAQIRQDKEQLLSINGYLEDYGCNDSAVTPSTQCAAFLQKKNNLQTRIEKNQQKAREIGCR